jgi:hypothetical protein
MDLCQEPIIEGFMKSAVQVFANATALQCLLLHGCRPVAQALLPPSLWFKGNKGSGYRIVSVHTVASERRDITCTSRIADTWIKVAVH